MYNVIMYVLAVFQIKLGKFLMIFYGKKYLAIWCQTEAWELPQVFAPAWRGWKMQPAVCPTSAWAQSPRSLHPPQRPSSWQSEQRGAFQEAIFCFFGFGKMVNSSLCGVWQCKSHFPPKALSWVAHSSLSLAVPKRKHTVLLSTTRFIPYFMFAPLLQPIPWDSTYSATTCKLLYYF